MIDESNLPQAVERAIAQSIRDFGSPHPTVPVNEVVETVMMQTHAKLDDRTAIVQQVCQRGLRHRYVLAFRDE